MTATEKRILELLENMQAEIAAIAKQLKRMRRSEKERSTTGANGRKRQPARRHAPDALQQLRRVLGAAPNTFGHGSLSSS